jgi:hypothetical protein
MVRRFLRTPAEGFHEDPAILLAGFGVFFSKEIAKGFEEQVLVDA